MDFAAIILAAGQGKRMGTTLPKVLVPVAGRPMIEYVLDAVTEARDENFTPVVEVVVVGYEAEKVKQALQERQKNSPMQTESLHSQNQGYQNQGYQNLGYQNLAFAFQCHQRGTADAVMAARDQLKDFHGPIVVMAGDQPMTQSTTIRRMLHRYAELSAEAQEPIACLIGTVLADNPTGMGRIVRNEAGDFLGIVEQKDATPDEQAIREVNVSYYIFRSADLWNALEQIQPNNAQSEYYLTDCPAVLQKLGKSVKAEILLDPIEALSVNTIAQRDEAERVLLARTDSKQ